MLHLPLLLLLTGCGGSAAPPPTPLTFAPLPQPGRPSQDGMQTLGRLWHRREQDWELVTGPDEDPLRRIWAKGDDEIWVVGWGAVLHWDGARWSREPSPAGRLNGLWGDGKGELWIGGGQGRICRRMPDGSWALEQVPPGLERMAIYDIWGSGPHDLYAVAGSGTILHSKGDGSWERQKTPVNGLFMRVMGTGPGAIWALTQEGHILRSHGDGQWVIEHKSETSLGDLGVTPNGALYAVGSVGQILHSSGDGVWTRQESGVKDQLRDVFCRNPRELYAMGLGGVMLTSAGDGVWSLAQAGVRYELGPLLVPWGGTSAVLAGEQFWMGS